MGSRLTSHLCGLALPIDADRLLEDLAVNDGASTNSSYTEAGPRPGASVPDNDRSRLAPVISGAQAVDLDLYCLGPGAPAIDAGVAVHLGYGLPGDTAATARGWSAPNLVTGWSAPLWTDTTTYSRFDVTTIPTSQRVVLIYSASADIYKSCKVYDPVTGTWGSPVTIDPVGVENEHGQDSIVCLPSGRLIATIGTSSVVRSDDDGATWELHARDAYDTGADSSATRSRMAANGGSILRMMDQLGGHVSQHASDDGGGSFSLVFSSGGGAVVGSKFGCVPLIGTGGFLVHYLRDSDDELCCRILGSAWESFDDAEVIVIAANACDEGVVVADPDGTLWAYTTRTASPESVRGRVSVDGGRTWDIMEEGVATVAGSSADFLTHLSATTCCGAVLLLANWTASAGDEDGSIGCLHLGGWSSLQGAPVVSAVNSRQVVDRMGFGPSSNGWTHRLWLPIEKPGDCGWTVTGAGTDTLASPGRLQVSSSANTRYYDLTLSTVLAYACAFETAITAGGTLTGMECGFFLRVANGSSEYQLNIRLGTTGIRAYDVHAAAILGTATFDTSSVFQVAVSITTTGECQVWYRTSPLTNPEWTSVVDGTVLTADTGSPAATGLVRWGNIDSGTADSHWRWVGVCETGTWACNGPSSTLRPSIGRPVSPWPVPLHAETAGSDGRVSWLSAVAGSAGIGETWTVEADHDFAVEHLLPTVSPSPDERWRSTTTASDQIVAWDFGDESWIGDSVALPALRCNFRQAVLSYHNGAAWVDAGTLDLATGFTTLDYSLSGDCLIPANSTASGSRYVQEGELAGGHVVISGVAYTIRWNTAGRWISSGTGTPRVRLLLDGDLSGVGASGQCDVCWPSGVLVVHAAAIVRARRWRVKIAFGQAVVGGYYEAGWLVPMAVRALGAPPDWGWSRERSPNAEMRRSRYGTSRGRRLGPAVDTWSWGWPSGVDQFDLRNASAPDYVGSSVGLPLAAAEDVPLQLGGLLELLDSGAIPCVALGKIPDASGTTITDPTLFLPGRLQGSVRQENVAGDEGTSEIVRVPTIDVVRIV